MNMDNLPKEIFNIIIKKCDYKRICCLYSISKKFQSYINHDFLIKLGINYYLSCKRNLKRQVRRYFFSFLTKNKSSETILNDLIFLINITSKHRCFNIMEILAYQNLVDIMRYINDNPREIDRLLVNSGFRGFININNLNLKSLARSAENKSYDAFLYIVNNRFYKKTSNEIYEGAIYNNDISMVKLIHNQFPHLKISTYLLSLSKSDDMKQLLFSIHKKLKI